MKEEMVSKQKPRCQIVADALGEVLAQGTSAPEGYTIVNEISRGGMAVVYLARQQNPCRDVALKVMLPRLTDDREVRARFRLEGQVMAALEHAGVLPVYQTGEWNGLSFIAMMLADGGTLEDYIKRQIPSAKQTVEWLAACGKTVHFAHRRGVLHCDLKPANLLLDATGTIYVGDFGMAQISNSRNIGKSQAGLPVGTPHYLAPELASGDAAGVSAAADIYSLGAVLYECLTGRCPYDGHDNLPGLLEDVANNRLPCVRTLSPDVPKRLAAVCAKALAKRPEDRHQSALQFVEDLRRID